MSSSCVLELDYIISLKRAVQNSGRKMSIVLAGAIKLGLVSICTLFIFKSTSQSSRTYLLIINKIYTLFTRFPLSAGNFHDELKDEPRKSIPLLLSRCKNIPEISHTSHCYR